MTIQKSDHLARPHIVADMGPIPTGALLLADPLRCSDPKTSNDAHATMRFDNSGRRFEVQADGWAWRKMQTQYMEVCGINSWRATCNVPGQPGDGVSTYPDSQRTFTDWAEYPGPKVSQIKHLSSAYAHLAPGAGSYDWAFDLFFDNPFLEVMIFTRWRDLWVPPANVHPLVEKDLDAYDIYHSGSYVQMRQQTQTDSGIIHWIPIFKFLQQQGILKPDQTLTFLAYGVEVLTTYSESVSFQLNQFNVKEEIETL